MHILQRPQELLFRVKVAGGPIPPDADTQDSRTAPFPLGQHHGVQDGLPDPLQIPIGAD